MKKNRIRQMILSIISTFVCSVQVMDCYPLIPAYFTALYLSEIKVGWILAATYVGMMFFMPFMAMAKYAVIMLLTIGIIKLVEWLMDKTSVYLIGILTALSTIIVSFCGNLLEWTTQLRWQIILLEGVFIFGSIILLHRFIHMILEWEWKVQIIKVEKNSQKERLHEYAESFDKLSKIFFHMSQRKEGYSEDEYGRFQNELTGKMCFHCDACAICWEEGKIYEILPKLIVEMLEKGRTSKEQREELAACCKYSKDMTEEAVHVFERMTLNRAWYNRLLENRQTIAEQLDAMAYIMEDCAKEDHLLDTEEKSKLSELCYQAKSCGIFIEQIHLYESTEGYLKLQIYMKTKKGCTSIKKIVHLAERILKYRLRGSEDTKLFVSEELKEFWFVEDTRFRMIYGIERRKKDGASVSGDNFSVLELENGSFLMGLSDGMGSGCGACKESEMVLDLVEKFLEAGFSMETAIRMMNTAMVLKGETDLFSTVDLVHINLYNGKAFFYKIGAVVSFLKREGKVTCLSSETLPIGVENNPEIICQEKKLKNGDFIVMITDGVLEYLQISKPEETIKEIIESIDCQHPGTLAKKIMEQVLLFTGGKVPDDMTILVSCIWEK